MYDRITEEVKPIKRSNCDLWAFNSVVGGLWNFSRFNPLDAYTVVHAKFSALVQILL